MTPSKQKSTKYLSVTFRVDVPHCAHISILEQEFERRAITVISFGVLASEFNVESKNMNRFAGERHDFFGQNSKGVPH